VTDLGPALTLGQMIDRSAERFPDREAIVFKSQRLSYARLKQRADDFARGLLGARAGPGRPRRALDAQLRGMELANLGIAKIGALTVTCNSRYKALEVGYVLRQSEARALVMVDRFATASIDYLGLLDEVRTAPEGLPALDHVIVLGEARPPDGVSFADVERAGRATTRALDPIASRPDDPVEMPYTSGTTGAPKGCLLSHGNMYYKCRVYTDLHRWTHEDRYLVPVPYFHIFGSMGGVAANCLVGSTQVLMEVFDPLEAMRLIEAERVTIFSGVPTMFITVLGHPAFGRHDLRSLRTGSIGAAPVPVEIMRRIIDPARGLGMDALVVYGLTEATGGTHWTRSGDPIERRVSTVGVRTDEIHDRVVDPRPGMSSGRARRASSASRGRPSCWATTTSRRRPPRRSGTGGCTPATWRSRTRTATCGSPAASAT
jgi:fatty-acyl-CoA synthase